MFAGRRRARVRWSLVPVSRENVRCLVWVHLSASCLQTSRITRMGATITTPVKKPVAMRCATLVRVIEVLPRPMSSHSIVAGWVHWKFTALCWYGNSCAGVSMVMSPSPPPDVHICDKCRVYPQWSSNDPPRPIDGAHDLECTENQCELY